MGKSDYKHIYLEGDRWRKKGSRNGKRDGKVSIGLTSAHGSDVLWQAGGAGWVLSLAGREHTDRADGPDGYHRVGALDPMTSASTHLFLMLYTQLSCPSIHLALVFVIHGSQTGPAVLSRAGKLSPALWGRAQTFPSLSSLCSSV